MEEPKPQRMLTTLEVIRRIAKALEEKRPLSVVRVGDGENICLAQYKVWSIRKTLNTRWGKLSRRTNWKGVRLPNVELRDRLIASIKRADIVGIPYENDKEILAKPYTLRPLTDRCFRRYNIRPKAVCHTFVNRHMVEYEEFWEMLRGKKAVVISRWAGNLKRWVGKKYNDFDIDFTKLIRIDRYEEISKVVERMKGVECDIVLISAGVNAVILAERLAREQGRVAIDFGKSAVFMVKGDRKVRPWRPRRADAKSSDAKSAGAKSANVERESEGGESA
ncbi:GT-D fold domain-containing glycosyltransferase [Paenibacillus sp.]|uniref:GT-D fold domain-containing protein n=1 Tax=Paenibacillus sp. TaxID=58172 RepID=UPI002D36261D|nr:GT-D fold domain-containing glycosyltransferase [Paenibacillus sp.]HZG56433.1 GT-D fold domain-containing glycosyltransferase [Paenibacillus sp.]